MKPLLAGAVILAALAGAAPAASPKRAPVQQGHCGAGETVVYSCRFGAKTGSICAAPGRIAYRFGVLGKAPEMAIASTPDWSNIHVGGNRSQGGLNQDHIRFTNGDTHYVVHRGVTGSLNEDPGRRVSGIAVLGGSGAETANLGCRLSTLVEAHQFTDLSGFAPRGSDLGEVPDSPFDLIY